MTNILTKREASCASARAQEDPVIPTQIPQNKLERPTVIPPQNKEYPNWRENGRRKNKIWMGSRGFNLIHY